MHIIILGAGITGVTAAYFLGRAGHSVEVIERQSAAALECSFANGGQLSYSHAEPWANPYVFSKLWQWLGKDDAPLVFRPSTDPHMIKWGLRFLWNCRQSATTQNSLTMLRLGMYSKECLNEIADETRIEFNHLKKGILHIYCKEAEFEHAQKQAQFQHEHGCEEHVLSWEDCLKMEPALKDTQKRIYGGIHAPMDESGDIHVFTQKLAAYCEEHFGAKFHYNMPVHKLLSERRRITGILTDSGPLKADAYVMSLGAYSAPLLRQVGISVPIYPMKGYSITWNATDDMPNVSLTDDARKIVYSRLGDKMRCAGTAEFARYNTDVNPKRIDPIRRGISALFPSADLSQMTEWACLRPSTPDGPPIVGRTQMDNLFMHTGHGTLGWTQSAGTAKTLTDIVDGKTPFLNAQSLSIYRY
jgi:D-amino-acid dehydrogenase